MVDEVDLAFEEQEAFIRYAMVNRKKESNLKPIGECHYCGEPFTNNLDRLFCSPNCEKAYVKEQKLIASLDKNPSPKGRK